jgi:tRNA A-37 threonylcarbamoyl transferase component Bud32
MRQTKQDSDRLTVLDDSSSTPGSMIGAAPVAANLRDTLHAGDKQAFVNAAWQDMRRRHASGESVRAEDYLPADVSKLDEDLAMDVIYGEYILRTESGEIPSRENYVERFPPFAAAISRQIEVHQAMESPPKNDTQVTSASDVILAAPERPETLPRNLGKYLLLNTLSTGGQADVYRAVHPTLGRELVLKLGRKSLAEDSAAATRLLEEGRILADLEHPNLVRVYDMGLHFGYPYLAMEYVRGRTLEQYAQDESCTPRDAARIVSQVAGAVAAAHDRNVLHLDIKPKNIIIDEHGSPRLVDFGLSRIVDAYRDEDAPGSISGTLQYMAPEQARGDRALIGRRTDVFGLGGVLYYMLTREPPFPALKVNKLLPRVTKGQWEEAPLRAPAIPTRLRTACKKAMATNVDDRFATAGDLAKTLDRFSFLTRLRSVLAKAAVVTALLAVVLIGWSLIAPSGVDVNPTLEVNVRQPDGRYVELAHALPLQNGDELKIQGQVPAGVHAALFLFTSSGGLEQLADWPAATESFELRYPQSEGDTAPLEGPPGTEFLLVCTDRSEPVTLENVRSAWQDLKPLDPLPNYTVAVVDSAGIRFEDYGKGLGAAIGHDDPQAAVRRRLESVLHELSGRYSGVAGIAFGHQR